MNTPCPHCKNTIEDSEALLCLYCGGSLHRPIGNFGTLRYGKLFKFLLLALTACLLAAVLTLLFI